MRLPSFRRALAPLWVAVVLLSACAGSAPVAPAAPTLGEQRQATLFWSQAEREAGFRTMHEIFPVDVAAAGGQPRPLPEGEPLALEQAVLDGYMDRHHIAGLMVLQDGKVQLRRHGLGFGADEVWESYSVAKSVTSMLLGIALEAGHVASLDDLLPAYVPELAGTAYADVTVRQVLTMTSGVRWNEDYADPHSDVGQMYRGACVEGQAHVLSYLRRLPRAAAPGTRWNYNTAETDLLGIVVERATGRPLAHYLSETIWQPYGMAADAYWIKDECDGSNTGGSGLSATLADYARLGQFMLDGGRIGGEPVVAAEWMDAAVRGHHPDGAPERGYGYQWWTEPDGSYSAVGIFGQMVHVDPSRRLVVAQLAAWPRATSSELVAARRSMLEAIKQAVDAPAR